MQAVHLSYSGVWQFRISKKPYRPYKACFFILNLFISQKVLLTIKEKVRPSMYVNSEHLRNFWLNMAPLVMMSWNVLNFKIWLCFVDISPPQGINIISLSSSLISAYCLISESHFELSSCSFAARLVSPLLSLQFYECYQNINKQSLFGLTELYRSRFPI